MDFLEKLADQHERELEEYSDFVNDRISELMKTKEYDPADHLHISEAISEANQMDIERLRELFENRDFENFGRKVWDLAYDYMEKFAESHAADEYNRGLG